MFAPGQRMIDPEFGDITADVIEALVEMGRPHEPVILEREQAEIARIAGQTATTMSFGHQVAQIHEDVFDHWVEREGVKVWNDKSFLRRFLADNPSCKVVAKGTGVKIHAGARVTRYTPKAGGGIACAGLRRAGKGRWAA